MSAFLRYSSLRLLAFVGCLLLLWLVPWMRQHPLVLLLAAATLSMFLSLFFLNGPREEMSQNLAHSIEVHHDRKQHSHESDEAVEDAQIAADGERYR